MNADLFGKGGGKPNFQRSSHAMYHNLLLVVTLVPLAWSEMRKRVWIVNLGQ